MDGLTHCPICQHNNPSENRFCGSCGTSLTSSKQLVPHPEESPAVAVRALPAKLGPTGKALVVGLATLAVEGGLHWLRHKGERADKTPVPTTQETKFAVPEYLISQSLEEVSVWLQEGRYQCRIFARREVRPFSGMMPTEKRR